MSIEDKIKGLDLNDFKKIKTNIDIIYNNKNLLLNMVLKKEITKEFFYAATNLLTPQSRSPLWEKFLIILLGGKKVNSRDNKGDVIINDKYYEIKISGANQGNQLHLVQIRPWQNVDYIVQFLDQNNSWKSSFFYLSHNDMINEIKILKGNPAHGTKEANINNEKKEMRFTIDDFMKSSDFARWKKYEIKIKDLKIINK